MKIIVLGGNSSKNKIWITNLNKALNSKFSIKSEVHEYTHWESGEPIIDLDYELKKLRSVIQTKDDYIFVAKSIGTVLVSKGVQDGVLNPKMCVFIGTPLKLIREESIPFSEWLKSITCKLLFIQNTKDPLGSFVELSDYLKNCSISNYALQKLSGDTHDYMDIDKLTDTFKSLNKI